MRRNQGTTAFSLSLVALFLATLIVQPRSLAQTQLDKSFPVEGGGFTQDPSKLSTKESVDFPQDQSFDKFDFENGLVAEEPEPVPAEPAPAEPASAVAITPNPTLPGGVDHVASGTGTRNAGFGTIRLRGVPAGATVVRAWLYWGTVVRLPVPNTASANFNGTTVTGRKINASTPEPCWLFQNANFVAYRASVRTLLNAAVNADYKVTQLASAVTNGTDPFTCAPPFPTPATPGQEGATLLVIYSHSTVPNAARTYIHQGPALVTGNTTVTNNLNPLVPSHSIIKQTRFGADGQVGCSLFSVGSLNGEMTAIGPNLGAMLQIKGPGSTVNTNSDWNGGDGLTLNQLWDTQTDTFGSVNGITNILPTGSARYFVQYTSIGDCFVTVAHVLTAK
ncbi:MAG: hypothetical protein WAV47_18950 [Blastocatellia bacterium]